MWTYQGRKKESSSWLFKKLERTSKQRGPSRLGVGPRHSYVVQLFQESELDHGTAPSWQHIGLAKSMPAHQHCEMFVPTAGEPLTRLATVQDSFLGPT